MTKNYAEGLTGALDKTWDALVSADTGKLREAAGSMLAASLSVLGLLNDSKALAGLGGVIAVQDLYKSAQSLYNAGNTVDALRALADALAAAGSLLSAVPTPQTRLIGTGMAVGFTVLKRGLDLYQASGESPLPERPSSPLPELPPDFTERLKEESPEYFTNLRDTVGDICRDPSFQVAAPPTYRVVFVDPLAIDLEGDGIETIGVNGGSGALFDHDGDGILTGTGWLGRDDAWLVRDLNANGTIDSGAEMFGDQTSLPDGTKATTGLSALGALDSNADGKVDANDAAFAELQVWQDLNQNGRTDAGELKTLAQAGLTEISLQRNQPTNGTRIDVAGGHYSASGVVNVSHADGSVTQAVDLSTVHDGFYSQYTDAIEIPEALMNLPTLQGMGRLRDLREAAALSHALADLLTQYASGTRAQQMALIDDLVTEWAKTDPKYNRSILEDKNSWGIQDSSATNVISVRRSSLAAVESFLRPPIPLPVDESFARNVRVMDALRGTESGAFYARGNVDWRAEYSKQTSAIEQALYEALLPHTRLKKYLNAVELIIDGAGVRFAFGALDGLLDQQYDAAPRETILDLAELLGTQGRTLVPLGWDSATDKLRDWLDGHPADAELQAALREVNVKYMGGDSRGTGANDVLLGRATSDLLSGGEGDDILDGGTGNDALTAGGGDDLVLGGHGDDSLKGQAGSDVLDGNAGNDTVQGGLGSDVYLFGRGDGKDLIRNQKLDNTQNGMHAEEDAGSSTDVLRFKDGVSASDLEATRSGDNLVLKIRGTVDQVTLEGFFYGNVANHSIGVDRIEFADGSLLTDAQIEAKLYAGGEGSDNISGTDASNVLNGGAGADNLYGAGGNDTLLGGSGTDYLRGQSGNDVLDGNSGNDTMQGGAGSDVYLFGREQPSGRPPARDGYRSLGR